MAWPNVKIKTIEYLCLGTIGLIVTPWKFDVLNTGVFALIHTEHFFGSLSHRIGHRIS